MPSQPLHALATALRHLHRRAGEPSTRDVGKAINFSHTTVAHALNGSRRPSWQVLEQIVAHLNGDVEEFRRLWVAVRNSESPLPDAEREVPVSEPVGDPMATDYLALKISSNPAMDDKVIAVWNPKSRNLEFILSAEVALAWIKDLSGRAGTDE